MFLYHSFISGVRVNHALFVLVAVDCFPVTGICCNGQVHTGSSVGFKRKLPCKLTLVHLCLVVRHTFEDFIAHCSSVRICILNMLGNMFPRIGLSAEGQRKL